VKSEKRKVGHYFFFLTALDSFLHLKKKETLLFHFSLFTFHFSLFTFHFSLFTFLLKLSTAPFFFSLFLSQQYLWTRDQG